MAPTGYDPHAVRGCDVCLPQTPLVIMIMSMLGRGLLNIFIAIGLTGWVRVARLTRAQMLSLKEREFCEAARAAGARHLAIIVPHLLPNALHADHHLPDVWHP
jgi:ABC-type dipeptide/oligopeptide/nickel transport system permease subunit